MSVPEDFMSSQDTNSGGFTVLNWIQLFCVLFVSSVVLGCVLKLCLLFRKDGGGKFYYKKETKTRADRHNAFCARSIGLKG